MSKKYFSLVGWVVAIFVFIFSLLFLTEEEKIEVEENIYVPISFKELPSWDKDKFTEALPAFIQSCTKLAGEENWKDICVKIANFKGSDKQLKNLLEENLQPYKIEGEKYGIFTGYYEAELKGSFDKTDKYNIPVYGFPYDMVAVDLKDFGYDVKKPKFFALIKDAKLYPYLSRAEIEKGINAPILLWVDNEIDLFLLHIQGSGRVQLPDGNYVKIGYASNNEKPFIGIGSVMKERGLLKEGKSSMPEIKKWLMENPKEAKEIMAENPRYIFFKINEKEGPLGSLGVPLTPKRSLAVDEEHIKLGIPLWLDTVAPNGEKIQRIVFAQDTGKAIKGKIRGDFFWGFGENAFENAGKMKSKGTYYLLLPKENKNVAR